jgi:protein dithiol:quinone oxidoreductase
MMKNNYLRTIFFAIAIFCFALVAGAYWFQHGPQQQQPCPLCILQRYAYLGIGFIALLGAVHGPALMGAKIYAALLALVSASGVGFTIWQLSKGDTMQSCLSDPVGEFVQGLPSAQWFEGKLFFATGGCADKYPPTFGLSLVAWSLICFSALLVISLAIAFNKIRLKKK